MATVARAVGRSVQVEVPAQETYIIPWGLRPMPYPTVGIKAPSGGWTGGNGPNVEYALYVKDGYETAIYYEHVTATTATISTVIDKTIMAIKVFNDTDSPAIVEINQ